LHHTQHELPHDSLTQHVILTYTMAVVENDCHQTFPVPNLGMASFLLSLETLAYVIEALVQVGVPTAKLS